MGDQKNTFDQNAGQNATDGKPDTNKQEAKEQGMWVREDELKPAAPQTPKQSAPEANTPKANTPKQPEPSADKKPKGNGNGKKIALGTCGGVVAVLLIVYIIGAVYFSSHFEPGTTINGITAQAKSVEQSKQIITDNVAAYVLTLQERSGLQETVSASDIDLVINFDSTIDNAMDEQNNFLWFTGLFGSNDVTMEMSVSYDESKLQTLVEGFNDANKENDNVTKPVNAKVSDYTSGSDYTIVPETDGNLLDTEKTLEVIKENIAKLETNLDLDTAGAYKEPSIRSDNADLVALLEKMNNYIHTTITYEFGKEKEVLDADTISTWLDVNNKKLTVSIDEDKLFDFVKKMASDHDTIYTVHKFKKTNGETIKVTQGDYGWWTDQPNTRKELLKNLNKFKSGTLKPVYFQEAASYDKNDYGTSYVEVDLGNQYLYYYEDGECKLTSYFVSGNPSTGHATPSGIYGITYKDTNHRMVGADYNVFTYYWLPFNGDIGFHDATWRSSFGGSIYRGNGSHGCVNMPLSKAKSLWNLVSKGTPVICYY